MTKVKLSQLIEAIEYSNDENEVVINLKTGEVYFITQEILNLVEDNESHYADWQKEEVAWAKDYLANPDCYQPFSSPSTADEYKIMEDFIFSLQNQHQQEKLELALQGKGVFRRFKNMVKDLGLESNWFQFREERHKQFALEWCEEQGFELVGDD